MSPPTPAISDIDPFSDAFLADPHCAHEALREAGPVVRLSTCGIWAVARFAEVSATLNDWEVFSSARGVGLSDFAREAPWRTPSLLLETDPPVHDRVRRVLARVLSPVAMKRLRERFALAADALIDRLVEMRDIDGVTALAEAFPLTVFPDAVGMHRENRHNLLPYGNMAFNAFGPRNERLAASMRDAAPVLAWVQTQIQRENLAPDGFGAEIHAAVDAGELTEEEAPLVVRSLLTAGVDTTVSAIGAALYCLARWPDQYARLRADPGLARNAFEEAVRLESPVQTFFRTTTRPTDIGGIAVPEGEKVLMFLAAANRDPRRWRDPDTYDIARRVTGHVGYGGGIHVCVGQLLARLEGEVVLQAMARKVASIEVTGTPQRRLNNTMRGLSSLPLRLAAA